MAYTTKSAFLPFALALVILSTTSPGASALLINGLNVNALAIIGTCHCSSTVTGACGNTCSPLSNIRVAVRLNGNIIAAVNTALDGSFRVNLNNVGNIINGVTDISNLRVIVSLPIAGCPIWAAVSTGHLEGIPVLQAGSIINGVANCLVPSLNLVN